MSTSSDCSTKENRVMENFDLRETLHKIIDSQFSRLITSLDQLLQRGKVHSFWHSVLVRVLFDYHLFVRDTTPGISVVIRSVLPTVHFLMLSCVYLKPVFVI